MLFDKPLLRLKGLLHRLRASLANIGVQSSGIIHFSPEEYLSSPNKRSLTITNTRHCYQARLKEGISEL
jgi:hypothetical protein